MGEPCHEAVLPVHGDHDLLCIRSQSPDDGVGLSVTGVGDKEIHGLRQFYQRGRKLSRAPEDGLPP